VTPHGIQSAFLIPPERNASGSILGRAPSLPHETLLRQEPALVIHLARTLHPISEIDVSEPHAAGT